MTEHDPRHGALLRRWGSLVARRARAVVVVWAVLVVAGFGVALGAFGTPSLFDRLDSGEIVVDGENQAGRDLLATGGGSGFSTYTQTLTGVDLADPAVATAAATAVKDLTAIEHVESAVNPFVVPEGPTSPQALRFVLDGDPASGGFATVVTFDADNTAEEEADRHRGRSTWSSTGWPSRPAPPVTSAAGCAAWSTGSSRRSRSTASAARASPCR